MKEIVKAIAKALVDEPDAVTVTEINGAHTPILELKVSKSDVGKVIGKQGQTATALRTILSFVSTKLKKRVILEIVDDFKA